MMSQYKLRDRHKSNANALLPDGSDSTAGRKEEEEETASQSGESEAGKTNFTAQQLIVSPAKTKTLLEVPVINMEDFQKVDINDKLDLLMAAINKINTNFHYKFTELSKKLTDEEQGALPRLHDVEVSVSEIQDRLDTLEATNAQLLDELEVVKGILQVQDKTISNNASRIINLTARSMSKNVVISGVTGDEKGENCKEKVLNFFRSQMQMQTDEDEVVVAHRIGTKYGDKSRPVVVRCKFALRNRIFQYTKNLKDLTNDQGDNYYVRAQHPDPIATEKREREETLRKIRKANSLISEEQKHRRVSAEIKSNVLYVNNTPQKQHIFPPTVREMFNTNIAEQKKMDKMTFSESAGIEDKKSVFKAHAIAVKSSTDVRLAYRKIKTLYPDADHVMLAYAVKSYTGHHDNGEYGASKKMLNILTDRGMNNHSPVCHQDLWRNTLGTEEVLTR